MEANERYIVVQSATTGLWWVLDTKPQDKRVTIGHVEYQGESLKMYETSDAAHRYAKSMNTRKAKKVKNNG